MEEINSVYKSFVSKENFEKFIEDTKVKFTPEIRKQLEKDKKALAIDKNRTKAERLFVAKGIRKSAYTELLNFIVDKDKEITIERTNTLLKFVETVSKIIADEKIKSTMKDVKTPKNGAESKSSDEIGIAKIRGKNKS